MNCHAEPIEVLLNTMNQRLEEKGPLWKSSETMAEGHIMLRKWVELRALTDFVNNNPIEAAECALADSGVERFPIISAAAEAEPLQFVRFWNRISQEPFLNEEQVQYVQLGLVLKDGANAYTLTFNHDAPAISDLLVRLSKLVEGRGNLTDKMVEGVRSGGRKAAQLRYFEEYGRGDWRALIPDLKGLVVNGSGDVELPTTPAGAAKSAEVESAITTPPRKSTSSLTLWLAGTVVIVAALGLLWLLLKKWK